MERISVDQHVIKLDELSQTHLKSLLLLTNNPKFDRFDNGKTDAGSSFANDISGRLNGTPFPNSYVARARVSLTMKVVGWSLFHHVPEERKVMAGFYVHNDYRRKGIGTDLYRRVEQVCRALGVKRLITEPWNKSGDRFFIAQGASIIEERLDDEWRGICESIVHP